MKMVKVLYKDSECYSKIETYETKPYPFPMAKQVAENLRTMGCFDFQFVPIQQAA